MHDETFSSKQEFLDHLENQVGLLTTDSLKKAFTTIDRYDFVPDDYKPEAYEDYPLPLGYSQTISQPATVAFMLEKLNVQPGDNVLDVGSGSGWTTALLGVMTGNNGSVTGVEIKPELVEIGQENIKKYDLPHVTIQQADRSLGKSDNGPYDRILVSAASSRDTPKELIDQLKTGGVMVIPVKDTIVVVKKNDDDSIDQQEFPGFMFVPLQQ